MPDFTKNSYSIPAEWEKHSAVWLAWPHDVTSFPPEHLKHVEERYIEIIKALLESERVEILVLSIDMKERISVSLKNVNVNLSKINFHITKYADVWIRDYGPMFVIKSNLDKDTNELAWVKWQYDAYTKKFPDLIKDNQVFYNLKDKVNGEMLENSMVLEGGSIEQNGLGTIITTEQCLLNSGRNPNLSKGQIEENLKNFLGATNIIWLKHGLKNDHTDGHTDDIAKFISPNTILCAYEENEAEENYEILKNNFEDLEKTLDQDGNPFKLIKIQIPHMKYDENKPFEAGNNAPASYTNFYIGNTVVLAPTYNDPNDKKALEIIQSCFSNKKVIGIDCRDLLYGGGAIHCMTREQPAM